MVGEGREGRGGNVGGRVKFARTCGNDLIEAGLFGVTDGVTSPAAQDTVIHIGRRSVIKPADGTLAGVFVGRNVIEVTATVEGPMEGHRGGTGLDLAN
jgi:hypothetical protein